MSDLHTLPLRGHDMPVRPAVRAQVKKAGRGWYWSFETSVLAHGPFATWREAYDSARRMVELL